MDYIGEGTKWRTAVSARFGKLWFSTSYHFDNRRLHKLQPILHGLSAVIWIRMVNKDLVAEIYFCNKISELNFGVKHGRKTKSQERKKSSSVSNCTAEEKESSSRFTRIPETKVSARQLLITLGIHIFRHVYDEYQTYLLVC